jgi:hypothetical protein
MFLEADVFPSVLEITWDKLHDTFSPPTLRVKCTVLKIGKCIWLKCHVVASPELQANWIGASVVYIWKSTQVTNNHLKEFRSMPLPSRALRSNLVTLVWLVVLIWNPITFFFFLGLVHPKWLKHDDTPSLVHLPKRCVFLGRRQRWAKHLLVFLLCSKETKEVSLAL